MRKLLIIGLLLIAGTAFGQIPQVRGTFTVVDTFEVIAFGFNNIRDAHNFMDATMQMENMQLVECDDVWHFWNLMVQNWNRIRWDGPKLNAQVILYFIVTEDEIGVALTAYIQCHRSEMLWGFNYE